MKKKTTFLIRLLLLIAFGIITSNTFAQPFQSIFGKEKTRFDIFTWVTCYDPDPGQLGCGETIPFITTPKDTISKNGYLYQYFNPNLYGGWGEGYVREDTTTGKIYCYMPELNEEYLMCDMTLSVGDTFQLPVIEPYFWYYEQGINAVVKQIDTIAGRKIIEFYDLPAQMHSLYTGGYRGKNIFLKFIEGIGPIYGPLGFLFRYSGHENNLGVVLCVQRDDTLFYMTSELLGCLQFGASIDENESQKIKIYPNPVNDFIHIEVVDSKIGGKLFILNSIGMAVYQGILEENRIELNISHLPSGFYSVLYETSKERITSKFIKL